MPGSVWTLVLFCTAINSYAASIIDEFYTPDRLEENITIRLLRKDWTPLGPSADTVDVMEEYRWDVKSAFNALLNSLWQYEKAPVKESEPLFKNANYRKDQDSIIIVHPIHGSADAFFVKTTITALAMRNLHKVYNIFAVHMPKNNPQMVFNTVLMTTGPRTRLEPMATAVSKFLVDGVNGGHIKPEQMHLIGWSYSGQLVGYMARHIRDTFKVKIASVVALDPYYNAYHKSLVHVSNVDAHVIHIYHTNTKVFGTTMKVGTADFVFNNGDVQPECKWPALFHNWIKEANLCSHMKVVQRFWYIILYPSKFVAIKCPTWSNFQDGSCKGNDTVYLRYPIDKDSKVEGLYYLRTSGTKPYGLGESGITCK